MKASFRIGRIFGIDIGIHSSWLLAFFLITWSLAAGVFPQKFGGLSQTDYWIAGVLGSILLFVSVLLHELAHSLVGRARGMGVNSITLFIFGGVSNLEGEPETPGTEFVMAFVGPLTSLVLGGIFFTIGQTTGLDTGNFFTIGQTAGLDISISSAIIWYLSYVNILLGIFNLIPGFPLDGGRVFRSIVWWVTNDLRRATIIASTVGQFFGWGFILFGLFTAFGGNFLGGIWIAFIGWFLTNAAESSRRELSMRETLQGVRVRDVMDRSPECVSPATSIDNVVQSVFYQHGFRAAPVCESERIEGIVTITDVKRLPHEEWMRTPVSEIMTREPLYTVKADDDLASALRLLSEHELHQLLVVEDGKLAGLLNRAHVIHFLQMKQELGVRPRTTPQGVTRT